MSNKVRFRSKWQESINCEADKDPDGKLGTYLKINPELKPFVPIHRKVMGLEQVPIP